MDRDASADSSTCFRQMLNGTAWKLLWRGERANITPLAPTAECPLPTSPETKAGTGDASAWGARAGLPDRGGPIGAHECQAWPAAA